MQRIGLITGATSGIGRATARLLTQHHFKLILCGRRADRLAELQRELGEQTEVLTLSFDIRSENEVSAAIDSLPAAWRTVDALINNAGAAYGLDPIHLGSPADWDAMIDINLKGLLYVSHCIIPSMVERNRGHIINIGSIAGREVYPNGNVYCATKFAVDGLTKAMRWDLNDYDIKVSSINPGLVETEFSGVRFKGNFERAAQSYQNFRPLQPEDIADLILFTLTRPAHVNLADVLILPAAQASPQRTRREPRT